MSTYDSLDDSQSALLEVPETVAPATAEPGLDVPVCTKCEAPMPTDQMVCRTCGFYPSLGITVEVDAEWERAATPGAASAGPSQNAIEELTSAIPVWAWLLAASNVAIVAASVAGRLLLPSESVVFEFWGVWQLVVGLGLVTLLHVVCFIMTASSDSSIGVFDMIISPLKAWFKTFSKLPERQWMVIGATNGVTLALAAVAIVGGMNWDRLWDWGIEAPTKTSLVEAIASAAGTGPTNGDLEDSIEDFAGVAGDRTGDEEGRPKAAAKKPPVEEPRRKTDCLIIGFELNDLEQISKLHLATDATGRLLYAGAVKPDFDPQLARELKGKLQRSRMGSPLVKTGVAAQWVKPRFPCRVSYTIQSSTGKLRKMQIEEMLPEIQIPW